jgi:hypothetical protein
VKLSTVAKNNPKATRAKTLTSSSRLTICIRTFPRNELPAPEDAGTWVGIQEVEDGCGARQTAGRYNSVSASRRPGSRPAPGPPPADRTTQLYR